MEPFIQREYKNGVLSIQINELRPDGINLKKERAYKILKPYFNDKLLKASVIWQEDEISYGVEVSISHVYIFEYLKRRISKTNFINKFQISFIDPEENIVKNNKYSVSTEDIRKAKQLRESADVFRHHNDYEAALRTYLQSLESNPADCISLYRVAEIYLNSGEIDLSEEYCKTIELTNPSFGALARNKLGLRN